MEFTFSPLIGIAGAALLGGAVGIQRQAAAKPAGFRTHLLVATASAGFTAMGAHLHDTRIPSYVVVGIGFLGSGAIVRQGTSAQGLTTAASIWMAAAIGLALGYSNSFGLYVGLALTAITLIALVLSDENIMRMFGISHRATLRVSCVSQDSTNREIERMLREAKMRVQMSDLVSVSSESGSEVAELLYSIVLRRDGSVSGVVSEIGALSTVRRVECSEPLFGT